MTYQQLDEQLRRVAYALETSVDDLLLHAPPAWWLPTPDLVPVR